MDVLQWFIIYHFVGLLIFKSFCLHCQEGVDIAHNKKLCYINLQQRNKPSGFTYVPEPYFDVFYENLFEISIEPQNEYIRKNSYTL